MDLILIILAAILVGFIDYKTNKGSFKEKYIMSTNLFFLIIFIGLHEFNYINDKTGIIIFMIIIPILQVEELIIKR